LQNSLKVFIAILFLAVSAVQAQRPERPVAVLVDQIGGRPLRLRTEARETTRSFESPSIAATERRAFDLMNAERQAAGLPLLQWSGEAARLASLHAKSMADGRYFSHRGLDGETVDGRASQMGIKWRAIGENIATMRGHTDPAGKAVETWMNSTGHKRNILNGIYNQSAIAAAVADDGTVYFTQVFLSK
jgi:uncharacterized protein YkwD